MIGEGYGLRNREDIEKIGIGQERGGDERVREKKKKRRKSKLDTIERFIKNIPQTWRPLFFSLSKPVRVLVLVLFAARGQPEIGLGEASESPTNPKPRDPGR
eukprot:1391956-Amorphochlora_amoeboformis.AAC.1